MNGYIDSIESMGLVDGPGIRMVVFMRGCKLRCLYCHNPEMWSMVGAKETTPNEILDNVLKNWNYYKKGGITFSGGEPLLQTEFLIDVLKKCKEKGIHTAIDTSGVGVGKYEEILDYTDLVILDIKDITDYGYEKLTGQSMDEFNKYIAVLKNSDIPIWIRQVIIPGINDNEDYIYALKKYLTQFKNIEKIELLPYHVYGVDKYKKLDIPYKLKGVEGITTNDLSQFKKILGII